MITRKTIWTLNFITTCILFIVLIVLILRRVDLESNDKDIIVVYFAIIIGIYMAAIAYLFSSNFKQNKKPRQSFYLATFPVTAFCLFGLVNLMRRMTIGLETISMSYFYTIILFILNIFTFFWGLATKRD